MTGAKTKKKRRREEKKQKPITLLRFSSSYVPEAHPMSSNQRRARSLHALHRNDKDAVPRKRPFSALDHAKLKLLLFTDPGRALDGFALAQIGCLMQWEYYVALKERDPDQARLVRRLAEARGIPERLEKRA